ncbi:MAG TPA: uroporphyrinogen decarboxylase family protein [Planctomycetota bacterium]|nr:uroporphyrinogen decarboxylase family protein [Planctomycetota bacterium]
MGAAGGLTNRKWIEETLAHRETGAVPYNFLFSPPALERVQKHYGTNSIQDALDFPVRMTGTTSVKPLYASPAEYGDTITDEFGVVWSTSPIDRGAPIGPCLTEPGLSGYTFPDARAEYRFEHIGEWCKRTRDCYRIVWIGDLWERATFMRGMEHLLLDVALHPEFVDELLHGIAGFILETESVLFDRFDFEGVALSDDYGTQKAMLMSPDDWRKLIKPRVAEIFALAKKHGRTCFLHSCGHVRPVIGDLLEVGLDILHPIQPEAMDVFELKREFGGRLTFCGGVRTQDLLPYGTPEEVREEVRRLKREMGKGGGYILEPGITLQDDVPIGNIVAMIDEARKPG